MKIAVQDRKGRPMGEFTFSEKATLGQLIDAFCAQNPKIPKNRQYFTVGSASSRVALKDADKKLTDYGIADGARVDFKKLPPQISYRLVFLIEYFGPILAHVIPFYFPGLVYGEPLAQPRSWVQVVAFWMVVGHFAKRELESLFVHRFSNASMPIFPNLFKNCSHYWILSGVLLSYPLYHPQYTAPAWTETQVLVMIVLFVLFELGNGFAHIQLRNLRPPGTKAIGLPSGGLFELVSCANYTYELAAWIVFGVLVQVVAAWLFFVVAFGQIYPWAVKKHLRLKKHFGSKYPRRRTALVPFLL